MTQRRRELFRPYIQFVNPFGADAGRSGRVVAVRRLDDETAPFLGIRAAPFDQDAIPSIIGDVPFPRHAGASTAGRCRDIVGASDEVATGFVGPGVRKLFLISFYPKYAKYPRS